MVIAKSHDVVSLLTVMMEDGVAMPAGTDRNE
jgi:hypothetical protein